MVLRLAMRKRRFRPAYPRNGPPGLCKRDARAAIRVHLEVVVDRVQEPGLHLPGKRAGIVDVSGALHRDIVLGLDTFVHNGARLA